MNFQRLRFLHIPKSAGTTFRMVLLTQYKLVPHFEFSGDFVRDHSRFDTLAAGTKAAIRLFTGHMPITTGIPEADDATIITFLRDPIRRVISFCQHVSEGKSPNLLTDVPPDSFDLDRFLDSGNGELSNLQTKMLINRTRSASAELLTQISPSEARDMALHNLDNRIALFGLQEYFDESLLLFTKSFRWSIPCYISANQHDKSRPLAIEQRHLDRIAELNSIDIDVYQAARQRFLDRLSAEHITAREVMAFRVVQWVTVGLMQEYLRRPTG